MAQKLAENRQKDWTKEKEETKRHMMHGKKYLLLPKNKTFGGVWNN